MNKFLTINITLIFAVLIAVALLTSGCSDVAGPGGDDQILSSQEVTELQDIRRRASRTTAGGESTIPTSCTLNSEILAYGFSRNPTGTVTPSLNGTNLTITFKADPGWSFSETKVYVSNVPPSGGGWRGFDSVDHDPKVTEVTRVVSLTGFSAGDTIYIGAKGQSHNPDVESGKGQTATGGDEGPWRAHFAYFKITYGCPSTSTGDSWFSAG